jgi:hypothetical protein
MASVLFATIMGGYDHATTLESYLGNNLERMGHEVRYLICDSTIPACQMLKHNRTSPETLEKGNTPFNYCFTCVNKGRKAFEGKKVLRLSEFLTQADREFASSFSQQVHISKIETKRGKGRHAC